jgi:hypothetical protein
MSSAAEPQKPIVYLTMIRASHQCAFGAAMSYANAGKNGSCDVVMDVGRQSTAFLRNYNGWWLDALNLYQHGDATLNIPPGRVNYAAMIHSDVSADWGWLDVMLAELQRLDGDAISAVVPFRDSSGLTSIGIDAKNGDPFAPRRFTMKEIMKLPETFSAADTDMPDGTLLINNGLCLCRMDRPYADHPECLFDFKIRKTVLDGHRFVEQESEDWRWSRFLQSQGAKYFATRKTKLRHIGEEGYPNFQAFGADRDDLWFEKQRMKEQQNLKEAVERVMAPLRDELAAVKRMLVEVPAPAPKGAPDPLKQFDSDWRIQSDSRQHAESNGEAVKT